MLKASMSPHLFCIPGRTCQDGRSRWCLIRQISALNPGGQLLRQPCDPPSVSVSPEQLRAQGSASSSADFASMWSKSLPECSPLWAGAPHPLKVGTKGSPGQVFSHPLPFPRHLHSRAGAKLPSSTQTHRFPSESCPATSSDRLGPSRQHAPWHLHRGSPPPPLPEADRASQTGPSSSRTQMPAPLPAAVGTSLRRKNPSLPGT
mmetsp:Transcript_62585/g.149229  ORF Transcript_62585/g.149229 Transcript_62585/m.149229 type:complete len:204 (+) Transcript_62585:2086-2697(+)